MRLLLAALAALSPAQALAGTYRLTPFTVPVEGATGLLVGVLNQHGDYGGSYSVGGTLFTFAVVGGTFEVLPPVPGTPPPAPAYPTAITASGQIGGVYGPPGPFGFVFWHNRFLTPIEGPDGYSATLGRNSLGDTFMTVAQGNGIYDSALGRGRVLPIFAPKLNNGGSTITSLNERGSVAGYGRDFYPFTCIAYTCREIKVSAGFGAAFINDLNQVAGTTKPNVFLYQNGMFVQYPPPRGYTGLAVGGIGNDGTIAGTATDTANTTWVFALKNGKFRFFSPVPLGSGNSELVFGVTASGSIGVRLSLNGVSTDYLAVCTGC